MGKAAKSISLIRGADGPTSVFMVGNGKERNIFKRIKMDFRNRKYWKRRKRAEKSVAAGAHTLEETMHYIKECYGAAEADASYYSYNERKRDMKCNLILRQRPELLGGEKRFEPPEDFYDQKAVQEWMDQIEEWTEESRRRSEEIPMEVFPTDYHMLIIDKGEQGQLTIEMDMVSAVFGGVSYTGDKEIMEPVLKDIYLYYGVSQNDIDKKSDRYKSLIAVLCG